MTAPEIRGWCPGALRPMLSGDGWIVRVRPHGGRLTTVQAQGIARLAAGHGNGRIDLSSRASLQIRGVTPASHTPLIEGLHALGLIDPTPEAEARRNIVVAPFWTVDDGASRKGTDGDERTQYRLPKDGTASEGRSTTVSTTLDLTPEEGTEAGCLPRDPTPALARALARALAAPEDAPALPPKFGFAIDTGPARVLSGAPADIVIARQGDGLIVHAAGATTGATATPATAVPLAIALARWFLATGGAPQGRGRMASHLARAVLPPLFQMVAVSAPAAPTPRPGPCAAGWLVALAFGQTDAPTLAALADLGPLRTTPWRMLLVEGLRMPPAVPGILTDPDDPLLRVVACTGAPACPQAHAATRPLARMLAAAVHPGDTLHLSGCAKGCAHPGPAALTLAANPQGWTLIRGGSAADTGQPLPDPTPADLEAALAPRL